MTDFFTILHFNANKMSTDLFSWAGGCDALHVCDCDRKESWFLSSLTTVHSGSLLTEKWQKTWQNTLVWMCVWTRITEEIFYLGSRGTVPTLREETRWIHNHSTFISITCSNTRHLNSTDDSQGILYQLSARSSHIKCLILSLLKVSFFKQTKQKERDGLQTCLIYS